MHHHVAHSVRGRLLFTTWEEGFRLWHTLARVWPGLSAACLMPDHIHVLHPDASSLGLGRALSGYARWKVARGARAGPLVGRLPPPDAVVGPTKQRRSVRYVHLNPCRARLVEDPLSWPLSTHLDAVGASLRPSRGTAADPDAFHGWVSADPTVSVTGSPSLAHSEGAVDLDDLFKACVVAFRIAPGRLLNRRQPARAVFLGAAKALCGRPAREVAAWSRLSVRSVERASAPSPPTLTILRRLAADPRIHPLDDGELLRTVRRYQWRRRGP